MMKSYYSNGKLLLTGEYVVLDGALALAIPTKFGQSLSVEPIVERHIVWKSFNSDRSIWFEDTFSFDEITSGMKNTFDAVSLRIIQILNVAKTLNPEFLNTEKGYKIATYLTFPRDWGLGTSSTLIDNVAQWAEVNAYQLLEKTFGGSGYDIACAQNNIPLTYQLKYLDNTLEHRNIEKVSFNPDFKDELYFVYLNKKQNSRDGITVYNVNKNNIEGAISEINTITKDIINCETLECFDTLIKQHETIISNIIRQKTAKDLFFNDFKGSCMEFPCST